MNKLVKYILIFTLLGSGLLGSGILPVSSASAAPVPGYMFYPSYWISGSITDNDNKGTAGRKVYFFNNAADLAKGIHVPVAAGNLTYSLDAFNIVVPFLTVPQTDMVYIPSDNPVDPAKGYGADAVNVAISGTGIDNGPLALTLGGGKVNGVYVTPGAQISLGAPPIISNIKFGNRIYQKNLVEKGVKFIVSSTPKISAKIESQSGSIKADSVLVTVNKGSATAHTYKIQDANISSKAQQQNVVSALTFSYDIDNKLADDVNSIEISAANEFGVTSETATVTVMGGPLKVVGDVITYPSPFSITKNGEVIIQYTLSQDGPIEAYIFSPEGQTIKKFIQAQGFEGGLAGVNKLTWNGRDPSGMSLGNGYYAGAIVSEGKILARFKLVIVD